MEKLLVGHDEQLSRPKHLDEFPYPEDWRALQGGKPRVFHHPEKPDSAWHVVHVYDDSDETTKFIDGRIITTTPPHLTPEGKIQLLHITLRRPNEDGLIINRNVTVPSFMMSALHGDICEDRSIRVHSIDNGYGRIADSEEYQIYLEKMISNGYQELRYGVNNSGFTLNSRPIKN